LNEAGIIEGGDGAHPGTLTIDGSFTQASRGTFEESIFSTNRYSMLDVSGRVSLSGTLDIHTLNSFALAKGEIFTLMDYAVGGLTGTFSNIVFGSYFGSGNSLVIDNGLMLLLSYNANNITLQVESAPAYVPVPGASALMFSGLGFMGWLGRCWKKNAVTKA
jgi:hypothetical protein